MREAMRYGITLLAAGTDFFIDISAEEFEQVKLAKKNSLVFLRIEERLDILLENFAEYEKEHLELALRRAIFRDLDWSSFRKNTLTIVRRLANLLSAARLYIDQFKHDLSAVYGSGSQQQIDLKQALSREYDNRFGYRVMEAVRNFVQHRSLPLHSLSYPSAWEDMESESERQLRFGIVPFLDVAELLEDPEFKKTVKAELEQDPKPINITPLVREYIEGIGSAHEEFRKRTEQDAQAWERVIADIIERAREPLGDNLIA